MGSQFVFLFAFTPGGLTRACVLRGSCDELILLVTGVAYAKPSYPKLPKSLNQGIYPELYNGPLYDLRIIP